MYRKVGSKIGAPGGYAMGLVYHELADRYLAQHSDELAVAQSFGRHVQGTRSARTSSRILSRSSARMPLVRAAAASMPWA